MSPTALRRRPLLPGALAVTAVLVVLAGLLLGSGAVPPQRATYVPDRIPVVGRTQTVCTVETGDTGQTGDTGAATQVWAAVMRQAPGREGALTVTPLDDSVADSTLSEQGKGQVLADVDDPLVLEGEGVMARASSAAVLTSADDAGARGLLAAPCQPPVTTAWLVGVGATSDYRSELVLTNPDDSQAELDLRYYGRNGLVIVPGSPNVVVDGRSSTVVSLESVVATEGPLTVAVRADSGRVSAVARTVASVGLTPNGAEWHTPSTAPRTRSVIPGIPEGAGSRELFVVNPGTERAEVHIEVLGEQGSFVPVGAERVEVAPESTASIQLETGLAGAPGAVRLTSNVAVTGSVVSRNSVGQGMPDIAVEPAAAPLVGSGMAPIATTNLAAADVVLSNDTDQEVMARIEVLSYDGVVLRQDDVLLGPSSTATRRLNSPAPSYLLVRAPNATGVYGAMVLSQPDNEIAGLATLAVTSPDVASRAPQVERDPTVAH
jgi:hypothetical protein